MYSRPANSMTPDKDPEGFFLNALRVLMGTGPEVETVHR
jgi:hypothetical protein